MSAPILFATTIALRGATLIDGTGAPPMADSLLVISNGAIIRVATASREELDELSPEVRVIDVSGKWIVPGLIDAHVHAESDRDLEEMFRWGVTCVRLMAEDVAAARALARRANAPDVAMPSVVPAAPIFTRRGGWWDQGQPPDANLNRFPATPEEAREAVHRASGLGSREIKLMLDDMAWCRGKALPQMDPEVARALLEEARRLQMRASVHAPTLDAAHQAVFGRATALAHGVLDPIDEKTIKWMLGVPVFYIPTMDVFEFLADTRGFLDRVLSDPAVTDPRHGLSAEIVKKYRGRAYSDGYRVRYPNFANVQRHLPVLYDNLRKLHAAGVSIALGTDMWAFPGLGVSIEMDLYVKAGLTPLEAIRAATQTAAQSLGMGRERGSLVPGRRADLLVLSQDPVRDVKNVRHIVEIYKGGEAHTPSGP